MEAAGLAKFTLEPKAWKVPHRRAKNASGDANGHARAKRGDHDANLLEK
jgi:hypothetical protein